MGFSLWDAFPGLINPRKCMAARGPTNGRFRDTPCGLPCVETGHRPHGVSDATCRHARWRGRAIRLWTIPPTAWRPRHHAGAPPSRLARRRDASLGGQPGEQGGIGDAGLAPDMHHRQLARAQQPGKGLRAHAQLPLRFVEGDQLWRRWDVQREVRLPRGRPVSCVEASGRGRHGRGFTSQERDERCGG
jgi:hypothetical protein